MQGLRRELGSDLVLYDCLLQIVIVEFPTLLCVEFGSLTKPYKYIVNVLAHTCIIHIIHYNFSSLSVQSPLLNCGPTTYGTFSARNNPTGLVHIIYIYIYY